MINLIMCFTEAKMYGILICLSNRILPHEIFSLNIFDAVA